MIAVALLILKNSEWLLPTAMGLGVLYLIYYAVRAWSLKPSKKKAAVSNHSQIPSKQTTVPVAKPASSREVAKQKQLQLRQLLGERPVSDRVTELFGSMIVAVMVSAILAILSFAVASMGQEGNSEFLSMVTWALVASVSGSWALLFAGKFFESSDGDQLIRRITMLGIGLGVGTLAFLVGGYLNIHGTSLASLDSDVSQLPVIGDRLYLSQGGHSWPAYVIGFAGLFAVIRWWKLTDPIRKTRLSLFGVGLCIVFAILFGSIFGIDLAWIGVVAGLTAVATQLSSPWIHPKNRDAWLREQTEVVNRLTQAGR